MKICPVEAELFREDGHTGTQTDRQDEANNRFSQISQNTPKKSHNIFTSVCNKREAG